MRAWLFFCCLYLSGMECSTLYADNNQWKSPDELVAFETIQILRTHPQNYEILSERYLDRAETHLLCNDYEAAFSDFHISYQIANKYIEEGWNKPLLFRSIFGIALLYGSQGKMDEFYEAVRLLNQLLASCSCLSEENTPAPFSILLASNGFDSPPLYGPDRVSIRDCIQFVEGTVEKCRYLIQCVPRIEARVILNITIDGLRKQAIACCEMGGIWKACLQPLTNKWYFWNQKWKLFAIPPDPAWD